MNNKNIPYGLDSLNMVLLDITKRHAHTYKKLAVDEMADLQCSLQEAIQTVTAEDWKKRIIHGLRGEQKM